MRVLRFESAMARMLPPRPPSPPSGPPRGTNFSRRKDAEPSPPLPAITSMRASSKNFMSGAGRARQEGRIGGGLQDRRDAIDPLEVLRLHQHGAQARDRGA